jgi:HSP20 family protein
MEDNIMTLVKFSNQYPSLFDRFLNNDFLDWSNRNFSASNTTLPSVNIKESAEAFEVNMAIPGFTKDDFKIELKNDVLTITSEKQNESETDESHEYAKMEYNYQSFSRSFTLPHTADSDKIAAKYNNGILEVTIPKKEETKPKLPKQIVIN